MSGHEVAKSVYGELRAVLAGLVYTPALRVVRLGEDPASVSYTRLKDKRARELGLDSQVLALPESTSQEELLERIAQLNADANVDGILVQLPLPAHVDAQAVLEAIDPAKDVDGFHPFNVGRLWSGGRALRPCTPSGILRILDHYGIGLEGREAVVVGRSNIVGKPLAALLLGRNATVTVAHSRTRDLAAVTRRAEVLVAAVGRPGTITPEMVREGAVLVDVGVNRVGDRLVGDVDPEAWAKSSAYTPVPGGVGPMTVAMLLANTVQAARWRRG
ncbi:bifunctional 5,10-methylenetetrahydrofolate dehydrogenase/5,10-methenyltetrahydrofolate cyclohydrolase [Deinococcota bacterium DY0809b]